MDKGSPMEGYTKGTQVKHVGSVTRVSNKVFKLPTHTSKFLKQFFKSNSHCFIARALGDIMQINYHKSKVGRRYAERLIAIKGGAAMLKDWLSDG